MTNLRHDLPAAKTVATKKANKKARRQARDMMRAHFDYDAIRADAPKGLTVDEAYDMFYDEADAA